VQIRQAIVSNPQDRECHLLHDPGVSLRIPFRAVLRPVRFEPQMELGDVAIYMVPTYDQFVLDVPAAIQQ